MLTNAKKLCYASYAMETTLDRITLNFGTNELPLAREIRKRAGNRGVNRLIKQILQDWLRTQES